MTSRCSFCGTPADAAPLFSGRVNLPSRAEPAFVCLDCATKAREAPLSEDGPADCSFCGKSRSIAARNQAITICEDCIEICLEVSAPFVIKP